MNVVHPILNADKPNDDVNDGSNKYNGRPQLETNRRKYMKEEFI